MLLHINASLSSYDKKGNNTLCHILHKDKTTFVEVALDCWVLDYCVVFSTSTSQLSIIKETLNSWRLMSISSEFQVEEIGYYSKLHFLKQDNKLEKKEKLNPTVE